MRSRIAVITALAGSVAFAAPRIAGQRPSPATAAARRHAVIKN
jgi:hypothetical protein